MTEDLQAADFTPYLFEIFEIDLEPDISFKAELIEVSLYPDRNTGHPETAQRRSFSLIFRGPKDPSYPQALYRVKHKSMDAMQIFLVPIGPDKTGLCYEAVFN